MDRELTIVVPALNEARRLAITVGEVIQAAQRHLSAFEVIIVNDGSTDGTGDVADALAARYPWVTVIHHSTNLGVGAAYHAALRLARFPYLTLVPGDNAFHISGLEAVFQLVGQTPLVISYRANPRVRTRMRLLLSRCSTLAMRGLTGCPIRDAHSLYVFPVAQSRQVARNDGYGYHIETLSTLLRGGVEYTEVPVLLTPRPDSSSQVMRIGVLARLIFTMARLYISRFVLFHKIRFVSPSPVELLQKVG